MNFNTLSDSIECDYSLKFVITLSYSALMYKHMLIIIRHASEGLLKGLDLLSTYNINGTIHRRIDHSVNMTETYMICLIS